MFDRYEKKLDEDVRWWHMVPERMGQREEKISRAKGITLVGRITLKQYEFLVTNGYDGEKIMKWTKYRAHKEISKLVAAPAISEAVPAA